MQNNNTHVTESIFSGKDLVCFSHLRWSFVYQRPQHLMSRFSKLGRVFFVEEPVYAEGPERLHVQQSGNIWSVIPMLPHGTLADEAVEKQKELLSNFFGVMDISNYVFWYYTPMALKVSEQFTPDYVVYDCMDELSAFKFAPPELKDLEKRLFAKADIVFTGGHSIYEAKKSCHANVHPFPSSIDKQHFGKARLLDDIRDDQRQLARPRFGFYGVVDERFDIDLLDQVATARPEWQFIIIGPVVKIDPAILPRQSNIHYLGSKQYSELPDYLAGWDIAMIPFAMNESTRYISPTKTPEYLAAGKPVISTPIRDVVNPYGTNNLVHIVHSAEAFIAAAEQELAQPSRKKWLLRVDRFLADQSWDKTWQQMLALMEQDITGKALRTTAAVKVKVYV